MSTTLACPPPCAAPWPSASVRQQALQRTAHWALLGRLAVGSAQERGSCGTPREQSEDQTRRYARGHAAPRGPRARSDAMAGAHPRDGIRASGTMSSPSARAVGGAALLIARGPPWRRARCALALWRIRRGAASRPAARGTWWSTARRDAPVLVTRRPPRRACRWRAAEAGEGSRWRGGDGRGSSHRPCALPQLPHGSRGDAPLTRLGPHLGPTIGTLFVVSACAGKHCRTSRAAKEPPMRQPRPCAVTQRHASP